MSFGLEYQHQDEENDDKYQKEDTLPSACIPLIPISKYKAKISVGTVQQSKIS